MKKAPKHDGLGVDWEEFVPRKNVGLDGMRAEAERNAREWWDRFSKLLPYLNDQLCLEGEKRKELWELRKEGKDEGAFDMSFMFHEKLYSLSWLEHVTPSIRLCDAKQMISQMAMVTADGAVEYPDTYEHSWGTMPTAPLLKAVSGTKFTPNRAIIGAAVENILGHKEAVTYRKEVEEAEDTLEYLKSMPLNWEEILQGEPLEDFLFVEREDRIAIEPSLESVLENQHLWAWGTYAVLDKDGWHAPGEIGMWAADSSTKGEKHKFRYGFIDRFVASGDPDDLLVLVDCHI